MWVNSAGFVGLVTTWKAGMYITKWEFSVSVFATPCLQLAWFGLNAVLGELLSCCGMRNQAPSPSRYTLLLLLLGPHFPWHSPPTDLQIISHTLLLSLQVERHAMFGFLASPFPNQIFLQPGFLLPSKQWCTRGIQKLEAKKPASS